MVTDSTSRTTSARPQRKWGTQGAWAALRPARLSEEGERGGHHLPLAEEVPPSLHIHNHKILTGLLPRQGHGLAEHGEVLHHTLALSSQQEFLPQGRHPHRGPA